MTHGPIEEARRFVEHGRTSTDDKPDTTFLHLEPKLDHEVPVREFSVELQERLQEAGFWVTTLKGESLGRLAVEARTDGKGLKYRHDWHRRDRYLEDLRAPRTMVAIDPELPILHGSAGLTLLEMIVRTDNYSRNMAERFSGTRADIAIMPVYVELAAQYLDATGRVLFPDTHDPSYTITLTSSGRYGVEFIVAGEQSPERGFTLNTWDGLERSTAVGVTPVLFPA